MPWSPGILSFVAVVSACILGVLTVVSWRRQEEIAVSFAALTLATALWAQTYGIQLGYTTAAQQLPWQRATLAISATVPVLLLRFAQKYSGTRSRLGGRVQALLVGEALVFGGLALSNPLHQLVWSNATLRTTWIGPALELEFAAGYLLHIAVAYAIVGVALWRILSVYFRMTSLYRLQSGLLLVGAVPAFCAHILYTLGIGPFSGLDLTPFAFTVTGLAFGLARFHFDLLERTPIAQRRAIELTGDGLLVVDTDGTIVNCNDVAGRLFDIDATGRTPVSSVLDERDPGNLDGTTITGDIDGSERVYDVHVTELADDGDVFIGSSVVLRDVTDRDSDQQRLEVTNRVLRHNLRNDMNVILGNAERLAETVPSDDQRRLAETIQRTAGDLLAVSEKARELARLREARHHGGEIVDVDAVLDSLGAEFRESYPSVSLSVECPSDVRARALSERAVTVALRNLLENAAEHNDRTALAVEITVGSDDAHTRVEIGDTGSGLPEMERRVLAGKSETPLQHGSGLGLWVTYWIVSASGGDITVERSDSAGTAVTVSLPKPRPAAEDISGVDRRRDEPDQPRGLSSRSSG